MSPFPLLLQLPLLLLTLFCRQCHSAFVSCCFSKHLLLVSRSAGSAPLMSTTSPAEATSRPQRHRLVSMSSKEKTYRQHRVIDPPFAYSSQFSWLGNQRDQSILTCSESHTTSSLNCCSSINARSLNAALIPWFANGAPNPLDPLLLLCYLKQWE